MILIASLDSALALVVVVVVAGLDLWVVWDAAWRQLYKNGSSRKMDSQRLFQENRTSRRHFF